jgi:hypothetical protein
VCVLRRSFGIAFGDEPVKADGGIPAEARRKGDPRWLFREYFRIIAAGNTLCK